eukprot:6172157-Pleurochrysis_carterae.AAC.1
MADFRLHSRVRIIAANSPHAEQIARTCACPRADLALCSWFHLSGAALNTSPFPHTFPPLPPLFLCGAPGPPLHLSLPEP